MPEVQDVLKASGGLNLGMDFLPGSVGFDPLAFEVDAELAGRIVWFDALINNVDRSWRNPNLLMWHGRPVAHRPRRRDDLAPQLAGCRRLGRQAVQRHRPRAGPLRHRRRGRRGRPGAGPEGDRETLGRVAAAIPEEWLVDEPGFDTPDDVRRAYVDVLAGRAADISDRITLSGPARRPDAPPEWLRPWVEGKAE